MILVPLDAKPVFAKDVDNDGILVWLRLGLVVEVLMLEEGGKPELENPSEKVLYSYLF